MSALTQHKNIPKGWSSKRIEELASINTGDKDTQDRVADGKYPFYVRSQKVERIDSYGFDGEAVLTSGDGVGVGKIYHYVNGKFDYHQRVYNIHNFSKEILGKYLFLYFSKNFYRRVSMMSAKNSVDSVRREMIADMQVVFPNVDEQKRIVNIMDTFDYSIENLRRLIKIKKSIKLGLTQKLLTGEIRLPGFKSKWKETHLNQLAKIYDGTHQTPTYVEKGVPFLSVEHLSANDYQNTKFISEEVYKNESKRVKIQKGDILMTRIGSIGAVKYIDWDIKASFYVTLALLKVSKDVDAESLSFFLSGPEFQKELWRKTLHVAFPNKINLGDIGECKITLPSDVEEQKAIANVLRTASREIEVLENKIKVLRGQRKYLLDNLLSGEIRTPDTLSIPK